MSTPLTGTKYMLEIDTVTDVNTNDRGTEANYKLIACSTSNGVEINNAEQTTSNKCDGGYATSESGLTSWSFSIDGIVVTLDTSEATTKVNNDKLAQLTLDKTKFFSRLTSEDQDIYREGKTRISTYSENAPNQDAYTFSSTFVGIGELFLAPEAP